MEPVKILAIVPVALSLVAWLSVFGGCTEGPHFPTKETPNGDGHDRHVLAEERIWKAESIDDVLAIAELEMDELFGLYAEHQSCITSTHDPPEWYMCDLGKVGSTRTTVIEDCNLSISFDVYDISIHGNLQGPVKVTYYEPPILLTETSLADFGLPHTPPDVQHLNDDGSVTWLWLDAGPFEMLEIESYPSNPEAIFYLSIWFQETAMMRSLRDGLLVNRSDDEDCSEIIEWYLNPLDPLHDGAPSCIDANGTGG